jgi:hypothetical protein
MKPSLQFSLLWLMLWCAAQAEATAIQQMDLSEVAGASELVFEGRVVGTEVRPGPDGRGIYTYVTFQVLDAIKGQALGETIQLRFLGGTLGDLTLAVSDMHVPQLGEHGIYCVESLHRSQANPLYGWDQGQYIVRVDPTDGQEKVYTRGQQAVTGFLPETLPGGTRPFSRGYALGLSVRREGAPSQALTVEQFKQGLRDLLSRQR